MSTSARKASRAQSLFAPDLLKAAAGRAVVMLRPDILWKNPVMFVVEVGTALSILYTVVKAVNPDSTQATLGYLVALDFWLVATVLFANFAEALAEARGKAQADALRKTKQATPAWKVQNAERRMQNGGRVFSNDSALSTLHSSRSSRPT